MKNIKRYEGIITNIEHLDSSKNGNPRYSFECGNCTIKTGVDSVHGYSITNYENKKVTLTAGIHYGTLTLNKIEA